jgi:hypothetical protein
MLLGFLGTLAATLGAWFGAGAGPLRQRANKRTTIALEFKVIDSAIIECNNLLNPLLRYKQQYRSFNRIRLRKSL